MAPHLQCGVSMYYKQAKQASKHQTNDNSALNEDKPTYHIAHLRRRPLLQLYVYITIFRSLSLSLSLSSLSLEESYLNTGMPILGRYRTITIDRYLEDPTLQQLLSNSFISIFISFHCLALRIYRVDLNTHHDRYLIYEMIL